IGEVAANGKAILLVSHDLAAVRARCDVAHLFDAGALVASGPPQEIVDTYLAGAVHEDSRLVSVRGWTVNGRDDGGLSAGGPCVIELRFEVATALGPSTITLTARRETVVVWQGTIDAHLLAGPYVTAFEFDRLPLGAGHYELAMAVEASAGRSVGALE